jgi:hypothetical protein
MVQAHIERKMNRPSVLIILACWLPIMVDGAFAENAGNAGNAGKVQQVEKIQKVDTSESDSPVAVTVTWYCRELDSGGLRYHYGRWALKSFNVSNHAVLQQGDQLDLEKFGMLPINTRCRRNRSAGIISCTDFFALFNLNVHTGKAAMAQALGWVNQSPESATATNDLSVTALHCRPLLQVPQWSDHPQPAGATEAVPAPAP